MRQEWLANLALLYGHWQIAGGQDSCVQAPLAVGDLPCFADLVDDAVGRDVDRSAGLQGEIAVFPAEVDRRVGVANSGARPVKSGNRRAAREYDLSAG